LNYGGGGSCFAEYAKKELTGKLQPVFIPIRRYKIYFSAVFAKEDDRKPGSGWEKER
jgi:hypothetical protein